jgi:hypothetical protein
LKGTAINTSALRKAVNSPGEGGATKAPPQNARRRQRLQIYTAKRRQRRV